MPRKMEIVHERLEEFPARVKKTILNFSVDVIE
jgi:hypothetical protein